MMPRLLIPIVSLACAAVGMASPAGHEAAARLVTAMGGAEAWSAVDLVIVEATHYEMREPVRYANRIINDFTRPRVRFEAQAKGWHRWEVIDGNDAFQRRDAETVQVASAKRAADNRAWWASNVYRTLRRLARGDPALSCELTDDGFLTVHEAGERLNWFRLNPRGEPVQYGTGEIGEGTVFGPLVDHPAGIRYPAWGASPNGTWRYEIEHFQVNPTVTPADFELPEPPAPPPAP